MRLTAGIIILGLLASLTACNRPPEQKSVLILVAASTKDAVREIADQFEQAQGVKVIVNAGSSAQLAEQLVAGSPGDLFLAAHPKWADHLKDKGLSARQHLLLSNRLVIIVPKSNPAGIATAEDLAGPRVKHVALAGPQVPAGMYARQALTKQGLLEKLEERIVNAEDVRFALALVERGEAEAGVVYDTDALISPRVSVVFTFPEGSHDEIRYPLVLLKAAIGKPAAEQFFNHLATPDAARIFKKHGFTVVP